MALTIIPVTTSQAPQEFNYESGSIIIEVYHTGVAPTVTVSDSWITCTWTTFTDNGSKFTVSVSQNDGSADRAGTVSLSHFSEGDGTFYIKQLWNDPTPALYVNPSMLYWDAQGGQKTFLVAGSAATSNLNFTTYPSWMTAPSLSSQGGGGYFYTTTAQSLVQDAPSDIYRGGTMTITDGSNHSTVANIVQGEVFAEPSEFTFGGLQTNETLYVYYSGELLINGSPGTPWLSISTRSSQSGFRTLNVTASQNDTGVSRSGYISLEDDYSEISVPVVQGPLGTVTISESRLIYSKNGGPETVHIAYTGLGASCRTDQNWLTVTSTSDDNVNKVLTAVVSASPNTGQMRTANFLAEPTDGLISASISAVQAGDAQIQTSVDPSSLTFTAAGETKTATVTYAGTFGTPSISYNDGSDWLTVTTATSGLRTKIASVTPSANPSNNSRTATVTFTGSSSGDAELDIFQAGAAALTVSPSRITFGDTYGTSSVTVDNIIGSVTTSKSGDWITIGTPTTSGTAEVYPVTASANPGHSRLGYVAFTDDRDITKSVTVSQRGIANFTVADSVLSFSSASGTQHTVIDNYIYPVTASITGSWITISMLPSSVNQGYPYNIPVSVSSNNTSSSRTGTVVLEDGGNQTVSITVNQSGQVLAPTLSASPSSLDYTAAGGTITLDVTWTDGTTPQWYVNPSDTDWISQQGLWSPGVSTLECDFTASPNSTFTARSAELRISNTLEVLVVPITQAASVMPTISVSPSSSSVGYSGGTVSGVMVTHYGTSYQTPSVSGAWLSCTLVGPFGDENESYYDITASANPSTTARNGSVTFTDSTGSAAISIAQAAAPAPVFTVSPQSLSFAQGGETKTFTVSNISGTLSVQEGLDWIEVSYPGSGTNRTVSVTAAANTGVERSGSIRVADDSNDPVFVAVSQEGQEAPTGTSISPTTVSFSAVDTSEKVITVTHPVGSITPSISYNQGTGWISCTFIEFVDEYTTTYKVKVTEDNAGNQRTASITFTASNGGSSATLSVTQAAGSAPQPASGDYIPIWRDYLYSPSGFTNGQDYAYRLIDDNQNILYQGLTAAPDSNHTPDPINIARIVENNISSGDFNFTGGAWRKLPGSLTVNFYKVGQVGLIQQWIFWNDWSRYRTIYDSTTCLNDPINGRGCQGMVLPLCIFKDDSSSFSMSEKKKNGSTSSTSFGTPSYKTSIYIPSYTSNAKTLTFKKGSSTLFTYDLTYCGSGYFIYRNRFGGWDSFLVEGNTRKSEDYQRLTYGQPKMTSYDFTRDKHTDRTTISTSYECTTGWLSDQEAERLVYHLISSPKVYFTPFIGDGYEIDTMKEVNIKDSKAEYKKYRNGRRLVQYTITFETADIKRVQQ